VLKSTVTGASSFSIKLDKNYQALNQSHSSTYVGGNEPENTVADVLQDVPHDDYCNYMREQLLLKFFDEIQHIVEQYRPEVCKNHIFIV
jgi:hypothetical protein